MHKHPCSRAAAGGKGTKEERKEEREEVKNFPELFKIGGCREEKSDLRIWDATVTTQGEKKKSQLYLKTCIY